VWATAVAYTTIEVAEQSPQNLAPQRFSASTASTVGARCATFEQKYWFFDSLTAPAIQAQMGYPPGEIKEKRKAVSEGCLLPVTVCPLTKQAPRLLPP